MNIPCVLVSETNSLLKRALVGVLQHSPTDLLVCVSVARDLKDLIGEISKLHPDVVLFAESTPLSSRESLAQITAAHPALRLIVVSEQSNWLHIFRSEDRLLTSLPDFLSIIQSNSIHPLNV